MLLPVDKTQCVVGGNATVVFAIMSIIRKGAFVMNIAERIQNLRKQKGISQEQFADKVGVSRQAVSKWESEQSLPDLEKIILMSEYFKVTTDYILKGIEPIVHNEEKNNVILSKILYIVSTTFIGIGLLCALAGWYKEQTAESIWKSMIIQVVGIAVYFIAKLLSKVQTPFYVKFLNIILLLFMPLSMITAVSLTRFIEFKPIIVPYPTDRRHVFIFAIVYIIAASIVFVLLRIRNATGPKHSRRELRH